MLPIIYVVEPFGGSIRRHNPALPLVFPDDAGITRGEGIFETLVLNQGQAFNVNRHLERFKASALAMDLPDPTESKWVEATLAALEEFGLGEGKCTWIYTRGRASTGIPTGWVSVEPLDAELLAQREKGVKAVSLENVRQFPGAVGAKTLNYASTMAALRQAKQSGADEVIFLDSDGHVLEGSRSSVITVKGKKLRTPDAPGIISGTTQAALFELAQKDGYRCKAKVMDTEYLRGADSVWLVSSTRGPVRVTHLDGEKLAKPADEAELKKLMTKAMYAEG
ncbi:hypothetical protein CPHO_02480 [Corynebacterium phocae]|uniref:4-amino-4-deoxychorismate lyase n=1 Tax=Corynebacterium phocae TaxID=161895 RepID=A0A1L7D1E5_9CORY|nr:aminodeoxychorismate lyase [Corynebacterium phocae]APT91959.1 hypothetical protein CPHO_02480 [Corynebacterium phocae]KAA8726950.1 aminodeoxychorismate lyase [Corynebacterium phocae]